MNIAAFAQFEGLIIGVTTALVILYVIVPLCLSLVSRRMADWRYW